MDTKNCGRLFEHTELFQRGIGETTDIVEKEMYTFTDRGGEEHHASPGRDCSCGESLP